MSLTASLPADDLFSDLTAASASLEDTWVGTTFYRAIPVTEVREGDLVLPAEWGTPAGRAITFLTDLDSISRGLNPDMPAAEILDDRHVRIYWDIGGDYPGLDCSTVFGRGEKVLVAR